MRDEPLTPTAFPVPLLSRRRPYPVAESMVVDGVGTIIASLFGSPFGTVMYFGHPAFKKSGAKTGFTYDCWRFLRQGSAPSMSYRLFRSREQLADSTGIPKEG